MGSFGNELEITTINNKQVRESSSSQTQIQTHTQTQTQIQCKLKRQCKLTDSLLATSTDD